MDGWKLEGDFPFVGAYFLLGCVLFLERVILLMIEILNVRKAAMVLLMEEILHHL